MLLDCALFKNAYDGTVSHKLMIVAGTKLACNASFFPCHLQVQKTNPVLITHSITPKYSEQYDYLINSSLFVIIRTFLLNNDNDLAGNRRCACVVEKQPL